MANQTDIKLTELSRDINETMSSNIAQVDIKMAKLSSEIEALKTSSAISKKDILNSKEINEFIQLSVEKAISKQSNEDKNTISKLREIVKQLQTESIKTKDKTKKHNYALNHLSLDSSLCKKVLSVKNCVLDKGKTSNFLNSITEKLHNRPVVFYTRDSSKLHLSFNTVHAAREFQREVVRIKI